jgi:hypothetical protein
MSNRHVESDALNFGPKFKDSSIIADNNTSERISKKYLPLTKYD